MQDADGKRLRDALAYLLRATHLASPDDLPRLLQEAGERLGARRTLTYLIDYTQTQLVQLIGEEDADKEDADSSPAPIPVAGTLAGRAFAEISLRESAGAGGRTLWTPILDGTERLGVLQFDFPEEISLNEDRRQECSLIATLTAELLTAMRVYGDVIERTRRLGPMSLPAEIQWSVLPPLTFATPRLAIAGALEPAEEVAGDSFDYSLSGSVAYVCIVDAMGHGLQSSWLATVAIAAGRNGRRSGLDLRDTVRSMDKHLSAHFEDQFVTAIVGELDVRSGSWRWVSAGHPPAFVVRGGRVVKTLETGTCPPLGLGLLTADVPVGEERLEPGDRLLLYSDGVIEARDGSGEFFGSERLIDFLGRATRSGHAAPEALRRLNQAILEHQAGSLQDDATTLLVEWLGDEPERMTFS